MVGCVVDSVVVVLVTAVPFESLGCEASNPPCNLQEKKKYETGNNNSYIQRCYYKSDAKTINLVLSVFVVRLPCRCDVVIAVRFEVNSTGEV